MLPVTLEAKDKLNDHRRFLRKELIDYWSSHSESQPGYTLLRPGDEIDVIIDIPYEDMYWEYRTVPENNNFIIHPIINGIEITHIREKELKLEDILVPWEKCKMFIYFFYLYRAEWDSLLKSLRFLKNSL